MKGILLTLIAGIGIGILLAPDKGSETWKKVCSWLDEYKDKLQSEASELGNQ